MPVRRIRIVAALLLLNVAHAAGQGKRPSGQPFQLSLCWFASWFWISFRGDEKSILSFLGKATKVYVASQGWGFWMMRKGHGRDMTCARLSKEEEPVRVTPRGQGPQSEVRMRGFKVAARAKERSSWQHATRWPSQFGLENGSFAVLLYERFQTTL